MSFLLLVKFRVIFILIPHVMYIYIYIVIIKIIVKFKLKNSNFLERRSQDIYKIDRNEIDKNRKIFLITGH